LAIALSLFAVSAGLVPVATAVAMAAIASYGENRASGSASDLTTRIQSEARLSEDAVRENAALGYDLASDDAGAARGADEFVDLASAARRRHILDGERYPNGGRFEEELRSGE